MMEENTNSNKMNPLLLVAVIAFIVILGYVFLRGNSQKASMDQVEESTTVQVISPTIAATESANTVVDAKTITIDAGSFSFTPNVIRVKKGDKIKIVMTSKDMMHDFTIDELNVKMPITKSGTTGTVEFTANQAGTFEYYCSVGQHRANGQVGTLIVED